MAFWSNWFGGKPAEAAVKTEAEERLERFGAEGQAGVKADEVQVATAQAAFQFITRIVEQRGGTTTMTPLEKEGRKIHIINVEKYSKPVVIISIDANNDADMFGVSGIVQGKPVNYSIPRKEGLKKLEIILPGMLDRTAMVA